MIPRKIDALVLMQGQLGVKRGRRSQGRNFPGHKRGGMCAKGNAGDCLCKPGVTQQTPGCSDSTPR